MQAAGAWLPLLLPCLLLLLRTSKGQNLTQNCSQDLDNKTCSCLLPHERQNCTDRKLSAGPIVGITLGLVLLLAGVAVGTVLGIRRKRRRDALETCPWKPSESGSAPGWQPRYSSRSVGQFTEATTPSPSAAPGPSSPGALLYENLFLGSQPSSQSPNPRQSRGSSPDPEALYMNYEDSSRAEHPIYGNVNNLTCIPDPQAPHHPEAEDEDEYVVPGC
ncbi:leucine-rich repeat-containing protein 25 isoform X2 [Vombatus ursinus]|uniref:leucine-rich repeat-containing protein 25 isoform X2 n=1 Tax=Vombatus ursinus TaxID=29139 RepID=UPI000FFD07D5|nr:leucine-rich repeat-containing protein 25 isoform X2 [Vombatus ursinus]